MVVKYYFYDGFGNYDKEIIRDFSHINPDYVNIEATGEMLYNEYIEDWIDKHYDPNININNFYANSGWDFTYITKKRGI